MSDHSPSVTISASRLRRSVDLGRDHARGGAAPSGVVNVVLYGDYFCPYCRRLGHVFERLRLAMGERLRSGLEQMIPNHDHLFESVRGLGLMIGLKMKTDPRAFVGHLREHGLLTVSAGDNILRILPPLVVEEVHIAEFVEKLSTAARSYQEPQAA